MKKLIILPGNSEKNRLWGIGAANHFGDWFDEVFIQQYDHWERGTKDMNVPAELEKLKAKADEGEVYVFAKSMGSLLTLLSTHQKDMNPTQCVFFGMPLDLASEQLFAGDLTPLTNFSVPSLAFHNTSDPTASFEYTKTALDQHNKSIELIQTTGNNHDYLDFAAYEAKIKSFLNFTVE